MAKSFSQPDLVIDQAARAMRSIEVPGGPPADVVERVRRSAPSPAIARPHRRRRLAGLSIAAAILLATGLVTLPKIGSNGIRVSSGNVAFADVLQELRKVRTLTYHEVTTQDGETFASRETVATDGKFARSEMLDAAGRMRTWAVYNAGRYLNVDPGEKTASLTDVTTGDGLPHSLSDQHTLADLTKLDPATAKPLGEREFEGKRMIGFRVNRDYDAHMLRSVDVWVDPATRLPARVEHTSAMRYPDEAAMKALSEKTKNNTVTLPPEEMEKVKATWPWRREFTVMTQIVFNVPVDESTFSIEPPKGYRFTSNKAGG